MSQYPILGNPTFRAALENAKPNVRMLLRNNPRIRNLMSLRRNDQLGIIINDSGFSLPSSPGKFETIFNGALSIGSQIIGAFGKNQTTQIASNNGKISALPTPYGSAGQVSAQNNALALAQANADAAANYKAKTAGNALGSGVDGLITWATSNPMYVFLGFGALYLLFKQPPGRRR